MSRSLPGGDTPEDVLGRAMRAVHEANAKIDTVHERRACPKCNAQAGERCRHIGNGRDLTRSHEERWTLEVPKR